MKTDPIVSAEAETLIRDFELAAGGTPSHRTVRYEERLEDLAAYIARLESHAALSLKLLQDYYDAGVASRAAQARVLADRMEQCGGYKYSSTDFEHVTTWGEGKCVTDELVTDILTFLRSLAPTDTST
jgi:hypothetical protein